MKASSRRWLIRIGIAASFVLVGWFLWQHVEELSTVDWRTMIRPVAFGLLLYGLALGIQGAVWVGLFAQLTATPWNWQDVGTYFTTHLMRRLPGAPWYMAGRAVAYRERSSEAVRAALAVSLLEWGGIIFSGLVWVAWGHWGWSGLLGATGALILLVPGLRRWHWLTRWIPLERFSLSALYVALVGYGTQWFIAAWMLYQLLMALTPKHTLSLWETGRLWAISGIISNLAVFAPAGLGIREASLVALLEPHVGLGCAAMAALLMRAIFTVGDLLWGIIAGGLIPYLNTP